MIVGTVIMIAAAVVTGIIFSIITRTMQSVEKEEVIDYDRHYAFIAEDSESDFWQEVFKASNISSNRHSSRGSFEQCLYHISFNNKLCRCLQFLF